MVNDLLSMAAAGSAVFLLWLALYPLTRERFPARWHYCALKASLFFLLFPIRPCLRLLERLAIPAPSAGIYPAEPLSPGTILPAAAMLSRAFTMARRLIEPLPQVLQFFFSDALAPAVEGR